MRGDCGRSAAKFAPLEAAREKLRCGAALRVEEAAALLGVAPKTVRDWRYRQARREPAPALEFRRYGGCLRVDAASVAALLAEASSGRLRVVGGGAR